VGLARRGGSLDNDADWFAEQAAGQRQVEQLGVVRLSRHARSLQVRGELPEDVSLLGQPAAGRPRLPG
jgi:hypothetical protein